MGKIIILPAITLGLIFYFPSLNYSFSQDDFIHLSASQAANFSQFINFFNPFYHYPDIFFFRPLTTQLYFFTNSSLFGLNPLPFHILALFFHLINSFLFFKIIQKIWKKQFLALLSATFYSTSAAHFLSLYYISAFQQIGRTFFLFLSILLFFKFLDTKKKTFYLVSITTFTAALLSKETAIILPLLLLPLEFLRKINGNFKKVLKKILPLTIPYLGISSLYIVLRLTGFQSIFNEGSYSITFSFWQILQNLKWYLIWNLGLPEILSTYPSLKPNSLIQFSKDLPYGNVVLILTALLSLIIISLVFTCKIFSKKIIFLSLVIYLISLGPILVLQEHRYPQYLDLAFLGFLPLLAQLFYQTNFLKKILGAAAIIIFITLQIFSLKLSEETHWTTHRAKVADFYYHNFQDTYPLQSDINQVSFIGDQKVTYELSIALAKNYALSIWSLGKVTEVEYLSVPTLNPSTIFYPITKY